MEQDIQRALITKYRKNIYAKVLNALDTYQLIQDGDKIAVCVSGGKDSMLLAKCMQEVALHGNKKIEVIYITMNPGYKENHLELIKENAKKLAIPLQIFDAPIFKYASEQEGNPCYICARMRRGYLYNYAKSQGCNKIALGHHLDDVIETTLLGLFYSNEITFMRPKLRSKNFEGMELIRPLYEVKEKDIIAWGKYHNLKFLACACPLAEKGLEGDSKRKEIKGIISELKKTNPEIDDCLFRSIHNLNISTVVGARKEDTKYSFNDIYELEGKEDEWKNRTTNWSWWLK